jgi:hypothetical protein
MRLATQNYIANLWFWDTKGEKYEPKASDIYITTRDHESLSWLIDDTRERNGGSPEKFGQVSEAGNLLPFSALLRSAERRIRLVSIDIFRR